MVLSIFRAKDNPVFNNGYKILPRNPPDCFISCNWRLINFILAEELSVKALQKFKTCVLVNNNLCRKLFSSLESPTTFEEIFRVISVLLFITDFNLSSCE